MVCIGKMPLFEKTQAKASRMILNSMDASFRSLLGAWLVHSSICGCVCVFASHITGWRFFYIFTLSSTIVLKGFVIDFGWTQGIAIKLGNF